MFCLVSYIVEDLSECNMEREFFEAIGGKQRSDY